jgi:hypothetical protein
MPTKIILKNEEGDEIGMSTEDFAKYRSRLGKENFNYKGEVIVGSGLGEASTIKTVSILDGIDEDGVKFNQSTIGITTKKALESASANVIVKLIKKGVFKS